MSVDFDMPYMLAPDLSLGQRDPSTVQIGTEPPRRMMITDAPTGTLELLANLDGTKMLGAVIADGGGDPLQWRVLAADLISAEILVPAPHTAPDPRLLSTRLALVHRYGSARADTILRTRDDAIVFVEGRGAIVDSIAELLVDSGIGTVHQRTEETNRATRTSRWHNRAVMRQADRVLRVGRSAPQAPPSLVIHADSGPMSIGRMTQLMLDLVPHLVVSATPVRTAIGPLVLPGRSTCLACVSRHRAAAGMIEPPRRHAPTASGGLLAAAHATEQALEFIDGTTEPAAVDTTIEYLVGALAPRYRNWSQHPDCGCPRFLP